ncbi:MAG: hypothetical protein RLZZ630_756 [Bacteroidota bacterium]|jgi:quinol monooxygenase YgiN
MITRFVRLQFRPEFVEEFLRLYRSAEGHIRNRDGCLGVKLLRDTSDPAVFFTLSEWKDEHTLDQYRHSDFFRNLWPLVKVGFAAAPVAFSTTEESFPES